MKHLEVLDGMRSQDVTSGHSSIQLPYAMILLDQFLVMASPQAASFTSSAWHGSSKSTTSHSQNL